MCGWWTGYDLEGVVSYALLGDNGDGVTIRPPLEGKIQVVGMGLHTGAGIAYILRRQLIQLRL